MNVSSFLENMKTIFKSNQIKLKKNNITKTAIIAGFLLLSQMISAQCTGSINDCDGDGIVNSTDLDDDNDGILDTAECPTYANIDGQLNQPINTVTANTHYNQVYGSGSSAVTVDFLRLSGTSGIYPGANVSVNSDPGQLYAAGTPFRSMFTQVGSTMQISFLQNGLPIGVYISFLFGDIDTIGEKARIKVYDEFGNLITNPVSYVKYTATGTSGTYPNGTSTTFNDLSSSITVVPNVNYVEAQSLGIANTAPMTRSKMVYFDFLNKKISKIEIENAIGGTGEPGFIFDKLITDICDTDGDGIPNPLDTDSDNDGCFDAVEGDENVQPSQLNANGSINTATTAGINANGVPNLVNSGGLADIGGDTGQGIGSSINALVNTCVCYETPTNLTSSVPVKHGITVLGRAGADNGNWPMLRNSAYTALEGKTKGFVVTRNSSPETTITSPVVGMMVFDTNEGATGCLKIYTGSGAGEGWKCFNTQTCP